MRGNQSYLNIPNFPEDPAAQKAYISLFMPKEIAMLGTRGPWTDEFHWTRDGFWKAEPRVHQNDDQLSNWVQEGIIMASSPAFQKDGTLYVFSTLNPAATPNAALRLVTLHEKILAALVFLVLVVTGLLMLRGKFRDKLIAIAAIGALVIFAGVFVPTFASQVLRAPLWSAIAVVGVLWGTRFLVSRQVEDTNSKDTKIEESPGANKTSPNVLATPATHSKESLPPLPPLFQDEHSEDPPERSQAHDQHEKEGGK